MKVFTTTKPGHSDHGITSEHFEFVNTHEKLLALPEGEFFKLVLTIPDSLPDVDSLLYGPSAGDSVITEDNERVFYSKRSNRYGQSRCIDKAPRPVRNLAVIGVRGGACFTMYGTQSLEVSPREPWDTGFGTEEERYAAIQFWKEHALAKDAILAGRYCCERYDLPGLVNGDVPREFWKRTADPADHGPVFNEFEQTPAWLDLLFTDARRQLREHLDNSFEDTKDISKFTMKQHNFQITRDLAAKEWTQYHIVLQTRTKEEAAEMGIKYRSFRYPFHFWVSPNKEYFILGKIDLTGKYIPEPGDIL
tara:strand:+ start:66 stop:983 length:918 start_codon:yes stop_codon:yes gene_type:complete